MFRITSSLAPTVNAQPLGAVVVDGGADWMRPSAPGALTPAAWATGAASLTAGSGTGAMRTGAGSAAAGKADVGGSTKTMLSAPSHLSFTGENLLPASTGVTSPISTCDEPQAYCDVATSGCGHSTPTASMSVPVGQRICPASQHPLYVRVRGGPAGVGLASRSDGSSAVDGPTPISKFLSRYARYRVRLLCADAAAPR